MNLLQSGLESLFKGKNQNTYNRSISLKYYFESHIIYKWCYYRQTIFNQSNIMVPYADTIGLCHSVAILWKIYVMRQKRHLGKNNRLSTHEIAEEKIFWNK